MSDDGKYVEIDRIVRELPKNKYLVQWTGEPYNEYRRMGTRKRRYFN
jgi:hypothetical protein